MARTMAAVVFAVSLVFASACRDDSIDEIIEHSGGADSTSASRADMDGWKVSNVIESGADGTGLYYIGRHRPTSDGSGYESRAESFRIALDGSTTQITDPPVEFGVGPISAGVATSESVFLMLRDCLPGGDPTSGGFGCAGAFELRFLRYDVASNEWEPLDVPPELADAASRAPVRVIPGQVITGGRIFFGVPSPNYDGAVSNQIVVFDIGTEMWSMLLDNPEDLPGTCTDGSSVFHFDGKQLLDTFAKHRAEPPSQATVTLLLDLHVIQASTGHETVEPVPVIYSVREGFEVTDVLSIQPLCMGDGSVLVAVPLGLGEADVPWPLRLHDGTWDSVMPDAALKEGLGLWQAVALSQHIIFVTTETSGPAAPKPARAFDVASRSWQPLPDLPGSAIPHPVHRAGPSHAAVLPNVPNHDDRPTFLDAP